MPFDFSFGLDTRLPNWDKPSDQVGGMYKMGTPQYNRPAPIPMSAIQFQQPQQGGRQNMSEGFNWGDFSNFLGSQQRTSGPVGAIANAFGNMGAANQGAMDRLMGLNMFNSQAQAAQQAQQIGNQGGIPTYGMWNVMQVPRTGADAQMYSPFGGKGGQWASANPYLTPNERSMALQYDWAKQAKNDRFNLPDVHDMNRGKGYSPRDLNEWVQNDAMGYSQDRMMRQGQMRNQLATAENSPLMAILGAISKLFQGGGQGGAVTDLNTNFGLSGGLGTRLGTPLDWRAA